MHVALGAYLLSGTPGYRQAGIHQYIRALLAEFQTAAPTMWATGSNRDMQFTALVSPTALAEIPPASGGQPLAVVPASRSTEAPLGRIRVEQLETPDTLRRLRADVFHGMAFVAPLRAPCPTVITVHDLSFITQPQAHKRFNRIYLCLFTGWSCRRAARVIAVSEWTKCDVVQLLGVDPARVDVIPHGVQARFRPLPAAEVEAFQRAKAIGPCTVFFLGSLEPRKNLPALIEAFHAALGHVSGAELIIGGSPGWKYQAIYDRMRVLGLEARVRFVGQIAQDELPQWYNACAVFAYPSLYEGFGLPALEAMACGAPVVTSNVTSLPEVVGDAGIMVAPRDIGALASALVRVLSDPALRDRLRAAGLARAAGFTWGRTADLTRAVYERVARAT